MKKRIWHHFAIVLLLILAVSGCKNETIAPAPTTPPTQLTITSVEPDSVSRGDQGVTIEITGTGFLSVTDVDFGPGINTQSREVPDPQHIRVRVNVTGKADLGRRTVVVVTSTGTVQKNEALKVLSQPPTAAFEVEPRSGSNLTIFTFDATSSRDPENDLRSLLWDFGDGKTAKGDIVKHQFDDGGEFQVELIVKDQDHEVVTRKKVIVRFFNVDKEKKEIDSTLKHFLNLFDRLEVLSPEQIVVDFSRQAGCQGRDHEIQIIEDAQLAVRRAGVEILGNADVYEIDERRARATLRANFYGTFNDGTDYGGVATHDFTLVNENGTWLICNFVLLD